MLSTVLRVGFALLLAAHGVAHLPGFVSAWRLAPIAELPYHTDVLAGHLHVGDGGMRAIGALWLLAALAFLAASLGTLLRQAWWEPVALVTALASLLLCALEWPAARFGVPVNVAVLAVLFLGPRLVGLVGPGALTR